MINFAKPKKNKKGPFSVSLNPSKLDTTGHTYHTLLTRGHERRPSGLWSSPRGSSLNVSYSHGFGDVMGLLRTNEKLNDGIKVDVSPCPDEV